MSLNSIRAILHRRRSTRQANQPNGSAKERKILHNVYQEFGLCYCFPIVALSHSAIFGIPSEHSERHVTTHRIRHGAGGRKRDNDFNYVFPR